MYAIRQFDSLIVPGAVTDPSASVDTVQQVSDVYSRYVLQLLAAGKQLGDFTQVAASATYAIPLPQNYTNTNMLHVVLVSDQTIEVTWVSTLGTSNMMLRAGLATDQNGIIAFCGAITSLSVTNSSATAANVEWMLFELPAITTVAGWRDGSLSTGVLGP